MAPRRTSRHSRQLPHIRLAFRLCHVLLPQRTWTCQAWIRSLLLSSKNGTLSRSSSLERRLFVFSIFYRHDNTIRATVLLKLFLLLSIWRRSFLNWGTIRLVSTVEGNFFFWSIFHTNSSRHLLLLDGMIFLVLLRNGEPIEAPSYLTARTSLYRSIHGPLRSYSHPDMPQGSLYCFVLFCFVFDYIFLNK